MKNDFIHTIFCIKDDSLENVFSNMAYLFIRQSEVFTDIPNVIFLTLDSIQKIIMEKLNPQYMIYTSDKRAEEFL